MIKKIIFYWLPVILWMALIYFLSSFHKLQASSVGWQDFVVRKTAHFLEYAILFVLNNHALQRTTLLDNKKRLLLSFFLTVFYALTDEFHQTKVSGRTGKPLDIGIDGLGAIGGLLFVLKFVRLLPERIKRLLTF